MYDAFFVKAQDQRMTIITKMPICTHLSNQIFSSQFSFGKAEPGKQNKIVEIINQIIPGANEGVRFLKSFKCNYRKKERLVSSE